MKKIILTTALAMVCSAAFAQKFAHVEAQEVVALMPEMDEVRSQIQTITKENQDVLKAMYDEYQTKSTTFQQKQDTWTEAVKESKYKELMDLEQRIQETSQSMQQEMQSIQQKLQAPVMKKFSEKLEEIAKQEGYIYVFDSNSLLYKDSAQSTDLTARIRKELNIPEDRTLEGLYKEMQAKQQAAE